MKDRICSGSLVSLIVLSTAFSGAVYGAEGDSGGGKTAGVFLEEIVVTSRKREERAQDVPIAISAFSDALIERLNITKTDELAMHAPNVQYTPGFSGSGSGGGFFIRGIGQNDFLATSDPGVAIYVDGVYLSRTLGSTLDLSDIERVEVLKGPQGTLFGKNATGGAINVTTKAPDGEFGGEAKVAVGNYNRIDASGYANLPISEKLLSMVSFSTTNVDGFSKRVLDGVKLGGDRNVVARAKLRWLASDAWQVDLSADVSRRRSTIAAHSAVELAAGHPETLSADPRKISTTSVRPTDDMDVYGFSGTVSGDLGDLKLKSITAYRNLKVETGGDFDGTLGQYNEQEISQSSKQFSQELQLTGSFADNAVNYVLGAFYLNEKTDQSILNIYLWDRLTNPTGENPRRNTNLETNSYALFSDITWDVSEKLTLEAGLRYSYEKRNIFFSSELGIIDSVGTYGPFTASGDRGYENLAPKVSLRYRLSDDAIAYASFSQGFKSGNYNGRASSPGQLKPFKAETVTTYEVGFKADLFDRKLRSNAAVYYSQYKDIQQFLSGIDPLTNQVYFGFGNAGDSDIWGGELELQYAASSNLTLFGSVGYTDNKYTTIDPGASITFDDILPFQSKWNVSAGFDYTIVLGDGEIVLGADYNYRSSYFHTTSNALSVPEDGYGLLNVRASYAPNDANWKLTLWGKNVTDESYITASQNLIPYAAYFGPVTDEAVAWFGRPAEYGATVSFKF